MEFIIILLVGILSYCLIFILFGEKAYRLEIINERINKARKSANDEDINFENLSFMERIIIPSIDSVIRFFSNIVPVSQKEQEALSKQLLQAGIRTRPNEYAIIKLFIVILFAIVGMTYSLLLKKSTLNEAFMTALISAALGYLFLQYSLARRIRIRQEKMQMQFPSFLDLLSVCVEAGLGFDQAIQYITGEYEGELSEEFKIVSRDISLGSTRKDALNNLQTRCKIDQLKTFTAAIVQADEMGISLKNILTTQATNVRIAHKQKVEEESQKLPVKILLPMVIFIFPIIFIVLLFPAVIQAFEVLGF